MHVIDIQNLTLAYNQRLVLQDFSAQITTGEFIVSSDQTAQAKAHSYKLFWGLLNH